MSSIKTPPNKPEKPPYMTKDQMHHVMAVLWSGMLSVIDFLDEIPVDQLNEKQVQFINKLTSQFQNKEK